MSKAGGKCRRCSRHLHESMAGVLQGRVGSVRLLSSSADRTQRRHRVGGPELEEETFGWGHISLYVPGISAAALVIWVSFQEQRRAQLERSIIHGPKVRPPFVHGEAHVPDFLLSKSCAIPKRA